MSAWLVDREHIRFLVTAAMSRTLHSLPGTHHSWTWDVDRAAGTYKRADLHCTGGGHRSDGTEQDAHAVGQMLWDENAASIAYRYHSHDEEPVVYGRHQRSRHPVTAAAIFNACDCYEYQSCEHPGWETSQAKVFVESLRSAAMRIVPGYDQQPWGLTENNVPTEVTS